MVEPVVILGQVIYPVDCLVGFKILKNGCIDHVSTSPPYNLKGFHSDRKKREYTGYSDDMPEEEYRVFIKNVIRECHRVLKDDGSFFLNIKTRIIDGTAHPPFWILENNPFHLKQEIIWNYPSTANVDKIRFFPLFEYVFWFVKDVKNFKWNPEWSIIGNVWRINHMTDREETKNSETQHPAPFPTQLSQTMILSTTSEGDTVLDPFAGSCTTLKVCRKYNRKGIGFEKYFKNYEEIAIKRIGSDSFPPTLLESKKEKNPIKKTLDRQSKL